CGAPCGCCKARGWAVLGLAFKGGTDDIRESPALRIVKARLEEGARLRVHDPQAMEATRQEVPPQAGRLEYCPSPYEAAHEAHALLIVTDWKEYANWISHACMNSWKFR